MNNINFKHSLKMPLSAGTVCTPYDSRMIEKRDELHSRIASRTKRQLKLRNKLNRKPVQKDNGATIAVFVSSVLMAGLLVTPFLTNV